MKRPSQEVCQISPAKVLARKIAAEHDRSLEILLEIGNRPIGQSWRLYHVLFYQRDEKRYALLLQLDAANPHSPAPNLMTTRPTTALKRRFGDLAAVRHSP
ncbi:MAG: hypothetical protein ACLQJR_25110 [Stellaceae bacterium]